jgi:hypothetical protein
VYVLTERTISTRWKRTQRRPSLKPSRRFLLVCDWCWKLVGSRFLVCGELVCVRCELENAKTEADGTWG